ncbi:MAG: hypothetical protein ACE15C_21395 [Phycisphaerae bacterium]
MRMILAAMLALVSTTVSCLQVTVVPGPGLPDAGKLEPGQRWVFTFANFAREDVAQKTTDLMKQARKIGYNGILVADSKFDKLQLQPPTYADALKKFRAACAEQKMKLIVAVTPFGYADTFLTHDPNLAEGMPVRKATFIVKDGKLVPFDDTTKIVNGSFEQWAKENLPAGWEVDEPGKVSFADDSVKSDGKFSLRQQDPSIGDPQHAHGRAWQKIKVKPWHYYHVTAMVKTEDWTGKDMRIFGFAGNPEGDGSTLNWQGLQVQTDKGWAPLGKTMDWARVHATFCSQDYTEVSLYMGTWGGKTGKIWWDDVRIEPGGFVNIIRRDSLPLSITSENGQTTYEEGKDFDKVVDPKYLMDPNPGYYTMWHEPPVIAIPKGSRLAEGQKVLASYHWATTAGKPNQLSMCMAEPKVYEIVAGQIKWMKENVNPDVWLMSHDEMRIGGWDDSCVKSGKTPGQLLADNIRKCTEIIKKADPGKPIMAWNDMFDPFHNARKDAPAYYLVKGKAPWAGSWEGLSSDVLIGNWMQNNLDSLKFFADRGNQQILAGYYDADPKKIVDWLQTAKPVKNIVGVMYTTWIGDYSKMEVFLDYVNKFETENSPKDK